jgi:hypothetical protein
VKIGRRARDNGGAEAGRKREEYSSVEAMEAGLASAKRLAPDAVLKDLTEA